MREELKEAVDAKMMLFQQTHKDSIRIITRKVKRDVIEVKVMQSLDMDTVRYIKKKKVKLQKGDAKKKRRHEAMERDTDECWRIREGRSKQEHISSGNSEAGAAKRRRKRMRLWEIPPLIPLAMQMEEETKSAAERRERRKKLIW